MADHAVALASGLVPLIDKVETVWKKVFERKDMAEDNVAYLRELQRLYHALNESMQHLLNTKSLMNAAVHPLIDNHILTVQESLLLLVKWEPEASNQRVTSRVRRTKHLLDRLKSDAREISDFLRTQVATLPQHTEPPVAEQRYIPDNNVAGNPPRLSLNYNSISTSEGKLKSAVLEQNGRKVVAVVARGLGGVGKTCALRGLAKDDDIRNRFTGGTLYIQLGNHARLSTVIQAIVTIVKRTGGASFAARVAAASTIQTAVDEASIWFRPHPCLFLIDDLWWVNGIDSGVLRVLETMVNERSRVVCTTRDGRFLSDCDKQIEFTTKETYGDVAREILLTHGGFDWRRSLTDENEEAVKGILEACQGLPVALGVAGETVYKESQLRQGPTQDTWSDVNKVIKSRLIEQDVAQYGSVRLIADTSLAILDSQYEDGRFETMFRALCVVEKQQTVPIAMLRNLWGLEDLGETMDFVNQFHDVCIVRKVVCENARVFIQLHDLILEIAIRKASEKGELNSIFRKLIHNYVRENTGRIQGTETTRVTEDAIARVDHRSGNRLLHWLKKACCVGNGVSGAAASNESGQDIVNGAVQNDRRRVDWWRCDDGDYLHDNLCRVLRKAGYGQDVLWLLSRPEWVVSRAQNRGIFGVEQDIEVGKEVARSENVQHERLVKHLEIVKRAAQMGSTHVKNNKREAWFQIHGRLLWYATQCEKTKRFVEDMEACAPRPWARASVGFLDQAGAAALHTIHVDGTVYSVRMDDEEMAYCWVSGTTVGVTRYRLASGAIETQEQSCDDIEWNMNHLYRPNRVSLSQDKKRVVAGLGSGAVWIWNTDSNETQRVGEHHERGVACVEISDDGRLIACGSWDGTVRVLDASSGELVGHVLVGHEGSVRCVAWSSDGRRVASGSQDKTVRLWDVERGAAFHKQLLGHEDFVMCVAWSADGSRIASGSYDHTVRVWDSEGGVSAGQALVGHTHCVDCVAWSADGRWVVSGSRDRGLRVWDVCGRAAAAQVLDGHLESVYCATWSSCGTRIASGSYDACVRVWEVGGGGTVLQDDGHSAAVNCLALNGKRSCALTGSADGTLRMWDMRSGMAMGQPFVGHTDAVNCVAWSIDETRAVSGADDGTVRLWEVVSQEPVGGPLGGLEESVTCVAFSRDGKYVASGFLDGAVCLWDVEKGCLIGKPQMGHTLKVNCVAWRWDGEQLASGSADGAVRVWDAKSGIEARHALIGHTDQLRCISWGLDGRHVASGSWDCTVRVWRVVSGDLVGPPLHHNESVREVGLSEDASQVVSQERGGLRRIWRVAEGKCAATSDDDQWDVMMQRLEQERIWTGGPNVWIPASYDVRHVQADGSQHVLGTCDSEAERIGDLWFSVAKFGHCRLEQ